MKRLIFVALLSALLLTACMPNYSDGQRSGTVTKLSYKGLIFKSWEGELVAGGLRDAGKEGMAGNIFEFNADHSTVLQLQEAMVNGRTVTVHYHQYWLSPWDIDDDHVVDQVLVH